MKPVKKQLSAKQRQEQITSKRLERERLEQEAVWRAESEAMAPKQIRSCSDLMSTMQMLAVLASGGL